MAMNHNLVSIPNLQYDPIAIPDYTVLELYKDAVADANYIGYYIVNIEGLNETEIETKLTTLAGTQDGYTNFVILASADNSKKQYSHKRIYGVFYNGSTAPAYPTYTVREATATTGTLVDPYQTFTIENEGISTPVQLVFTVDSVDEPIEWLLNNNYGATVLDKAGKLVVGQESTINGEPVDVDYAEIPCLMHGTNTLKVKATNVSKVECKYTVLY